MEGRDPLIDEAEDAMAARVPEDEKDLRACLFCSLIKTANQFMQHGCENCEEFLEMADNADRMYQCTSTNFKGMTAIMDTSGRDAQGSWVCSWLRLDKMVQGCYALSVTGKLPEEIKEELEERADLVYVNRDRSKVVASA